MDGTITKAPWAVDYVNWGDPVNTFGQGRIWLLYNEKQILASAGIDNGYTVSSEAWDANDGIEIRYWDVPGQAALADYREAGTREVIWSGTVGEFTRLTEDDFSKILDGRLGSSMARVCLMAVSAAFAS